MSICDVQRINPCKFLIYFRNDLIFINHPYSVCDLILFCKIICCFMMIFPVIHQCKQRIRISACQKNRPGICITGIYMVDPVLFLIFSGKLMFLHYTIHIIINGTASYDTGLCLSFSYKFIYIVTGLLILNKNSLFFHIVKIFFCFFINPLIIQICFRFQIHFRSVNMKKRQGILISD